MATWTKQTEASSTWTEVTATTNGCDTSDGGFLSGSGGFLGDPFLTVTTTSGWTKQEKDC